MRDHPFWNNMTIPDGSESIGRIIVGKTRVVTVDQINGKFHIIQGNLFNVGDVEIFDDAESALRRIMEVAKCL